MRKFLLGIILFAVFHCLICLTISFISPYHFGNPWFSAKIQFLENSESENFNTFFIGSSRTFRHFDPETIDEEVAKNGIDFKSFNLGAPATFAPQTYFLLENFLKSDLLEVNDVEFIFIELAGIYKIPRRRLHQERSSYWLTPKEYHFGATEFLQDQSQDLRNKVESIGIYTLTFLEGLFHVGHFSQQFREWDYYNDEYLGPNQKGFLPLDYQLRNTENSIVKANHARRTESIRSKDAPELFDKRIRRAEKVRVQTGRTPSQSHLNRITALIKLAQTKNVNLIFVLNSRTSTTQDISLYNQIPHKNRIDLANPLEIPELYSLDMSFDEGHLSSEGAFLYSRYAGEKIARHIAKFHQ